MLLFTDSFDHYATADLTTKWTSWAINSPTIGAGGRRGTNGMRVPSGFYDARKTVPAAQTLRTGGAYYFESFPAIIQVFRESGIVHLTLAVLADGRLAVYRGSGLSTQLDVSDASIAINNHYFIEFRGKIGDGDGAWEVRVNEVEVLNGTGDTQDGGSPIVSSVGVGSNSALGNGGQGSFILDDYYILDESGSVNNGFLGDIRVDADEPTSDGANTGLTPSSGMDHYALVDEATPNDDTDYNSSSNVGDKDTYGFDGITHNPASIFGVQVLPYVKKDDAGARTIAAVVRSGGTDYAGSGQAPSDSGYLYLPEIFETDPDTAAAWTKTGVNAAEFGMSIAS